MSLGNIIDKLHDKHGLTYTGTTEQTNLTTLKVRLQKVDDLDTCCEHLLRGREFFILRSLTVNRILVLLTELLHAVNRLTDNVEHTTLDLIA